MPTTEVKTDMTPKGVVATAINSTSTPTVEQKPGQTASAPGRVEPSKETKPEAGKRNPDEQKPVEVKLEAKAV